MEKVVLVDGNNLIFRSYYATAYQGNVMKNSKGFPTNAIYGFLAMINKIVTEENPTYMAVAFDVGKNFRWEKYKDYKAGRIATPDELKMQMPVAKNLLTAMGITYLEKEMYEADDIIGTLVKKAELDPNFISTIVSSDKDLIQLISNETDIKLLKMKDYIRYNPESFKKDYGIDPIKIIDLKALAGDSSDNIPGVRGIGDKTALKLLTTYGSLEGIYENIDKITGKVQEKLILDKEQAFFSKELATIYRDVPLDVSFEDLKVKEKDMTKIKEIYEELEFFSMLKNMNNNDKKDIEITYQVLEDVNLLKDDLYALYIEIDNNNYHDANIVKVALSSKENNYIVPNGLLNEVILKIKDKIIYTYDAKKHYVILNKLGIDITFTYDLMIMSYLLEENIKDDIAYLMMQNNVDVTAYDVIKKASFEVSDLDKIECLKAKFILDNCEIKKEAIIKEGMDNLFSNIEMPLAKVLAKMELNGILVSKDVLENMKIEVKNTLDKLSLEIYDLAGEEFNINSPKQLGVILFEKLNLPHGKGNKTGYKTDATSLNKIINSHEIIGKILEYRNFNKLYTTYLEGLEPYIKEDGKIHTIYKQTLTRTGRLSSVEPNLQNIPSRAEEGKKIRQAFIPSYDYFVSIDYSQIELRLMAHVSKSKELIEAFKNNMDIHTKVAADINGIDVSEVTKKQRSYAKAVIFGIIYGISGFGLGENLSISPKEAKDFIDKYYEIYPSVKKYMDNTIKEAYETKCVRTLFNRKRTIDELNNKNYMIRSSGERIALNTPIQGTCADILKLAMVKIDEEFTKRNLKSKMILQIHDELVFDCPKEEKDLVSNLAEEIMENVISLDVPIRADSSFGINWYEAK